MPPSEVPTNFCLVLLSSDALLVYDFDGFVFAMLIDDLIDPSKPTLKSARPAVFGMQGLANKLQGDTSFPPESTPR